MRIKMTDYNRCKRCDKLLPRIKSKRQYKIHCSNCARTKGHILNKKDFKNGFKPSVYVEEEELFEDDPRALKEKDYGRHFHLPRGTVRTKIEID